MTAREMVETELKRLADILAKRGGFFPDEQDRRDALAQVIVWMDEEKAEAERIEQEAAAAEEIEREEKRRADPNFKTRELFKNVKIDVPQKGAMRR